MELSELRIGNIIRSMIDITATPTGTLTTEGKVAQIHSDAIWMGSDGGIRFGIDDCRFEGIPLTTDWLAKAANSQEFFHDGVTIYKFGHFNAYHQGKIWIAESLHMGKQYPHVKYIHQLQNLYFALTGQELEVKLASNS